MMKEINFKSSDNQRKIISYDKGYIYYRIYLVLRVVIRSYLRQENPDLSLKLIKYAREIRNWTLDSNVLHIFREDLGEGITFEDNNNNKIKLENLG